MTFETGVLIQSNFTDPKIIENIQGPRDDQLVTSQNIWCLQYGISPCNQHIFRLKLERYNQN